MQFNSIVYEIPDTSDHLFEVHINHQFENGCNSAEYQHVNAIAWCYFNCKNVVYVGKNNEILGIFWFESQSEATLFQVMWG
jgi:hypothetical protein